MATKLLIWLIYYFHIINYSKKINSNFSATFFIALIWAADPNLETETPTLIIGLISALKRSADNNIYPSVMETTLLEI